MNSRLVALTLQRLNYWLPPETVLPQTVSLIKRNVNFTLVKLNKPGFSRLEVNKDLKPETCGNFQAG